MILAGPEKPRVKIPVATYRLQFNKSLTFDRARSLVPYVAALGVTDCYASPIFKARSGSEHGYDVVDHRSLNPELGNTAAFRRFSSSLKRHKIGLILDVVPNHMSIDASQNPWWNDVLENGSSSAYASYFDIDWKPPKAELENKILLPELGDQFGRELERKKIQITYENGGFFVCYGTNRYPVAPRSWSLILDMVLLNLPDKVRGEKEAMLETKSIRTAISYLPGPTEGNAEKIEEWYREKEIISRRFGKLLDNSSHVQKALHRALVALNGDPSNPRSFDQLEILLQEQVYRLCHWKVASDEINYRRFFDVNHLAAIRIEDPKVFEAVHSLLFPMIREGVVSGLRIDHVDGLLDPYQYLKDLQTRCRELTEGKDGVYVVVEKILLGDERGKSTWDMQGTTGYDFLNDLNGIFVARKNRETFVSLYSRFTGLYRETGDLAASCKRLILHVSMASELHVLAVLLDEISEQHRWSRDFTFESLRFALREVIAHFPVYRTYVQPENGGAGAEDRVRIIAAVLEAKLQNPATSDSIFDFVADVLLLRDPEGLSVEQISVRRTFVLRFQQLTGPVMAKAIEDTAFYRYFPLASLNEVGGSLSSFGETIEAFHARNLERQRRFPGALLATTTHDTKRSEDVRARLNVLSEIPVKWYRSILRWSSVNKSKKAVINRYPTPDANEEYFLYQTLVGTWPLGRMSLEAHGEYVKRIENYMIKAMREAKIHTSWISPNEEYEKGVCLFVSSILEFSQDNKFLDDFLEFQKEIARAGLNNSLAQLVLKLTSPGVPDFYQGTELWNFTLVDPDNRQPVDYERIKLIVDEIKAGIKTGRLALATRLMENNEEGGIKLYLLLAGLECRNRHQDLFQTGEYTPLEVEGPLKDHICAFARTAGDRMVITVVQRFLTTLEADSSSPERKNEGGPTILKLKGVLRSQMLRDVFTGKEIQPAVDETGIEIPLTELLRTLPVALLEQMS